MATKKQVDHHEADEIVRAVDLELKDMVIN